MLCLEMLAGLPPEGCQQLKLSGGAIAHHGASLVPEGPGATRASGGKKQSSCSRLVHISTPDPSPENGVWHPAVSKGLSEGKPQVYLCALSAKFHILGLRVSRVPFSFQT